MPLTRTPRRPLTCDFATSWRSSTLRAARPTAKPPWSLRERLDEHDIAELITAYCDGATAASLATAHGVSLTSVKRVLHTAGVRHAPSIRLPQRVDRRG